MENTQLNDLAEKLRLMLNVAPKRGKTPMFYLFGVMHAEELRDTPLSELHYIAHRAGSPGLTMGKEIRKGIMLAPFVDVKPTFQRQPSIWEWPQSAD